MVNVKRTSTTNSISYSEIVNAQNGLRALGYYSGPNCGYVSDEMRTSICNFQKANNLKETGELTKDVYDEIMSKYKEMQNKLSTLGFYDGKANHVTKAIKNFQKLYGLTENGKCDSKTNEMLTKVHSDYTKLYNSEALNTISKELGHDEAQKDAFVKVYVFLKNGMGLNTHQIAGVMGNLHAESAILPDNVQNGTCSGEHNEGEYTYKERDGVGFGLLQWSDSVRKTELKKMAETMAYSSSQQDVDKALWDINVQLAYFKKEMTTKIEGLKDYSKIWNKIKSTYSYSYNEVSDIFLKEIETPNNWESKKAARRDHSKKIYEALITL